MVSTGQCLRKMATILILSDPSFRRQVLTQILFLFQYLNGYVKFRPATNVLPYAQR